jgi:hypothetical protein
LLPNCAQHSSRFAGSGANLKKQDPVNDSREEVMKRIVFALVGAGALAGAIAATVPVSGQSEAKLRQSTGSNSLRDIVTGA